MAKSPQHATLSTATERLDYQKYAKMDRASLQAIMASRSMPERFLGLAKEDAVTAIMTNDG